MLSYKACVHARMHAETCAHRQPENGCQRAGCRRNVRLGLVVWPKPGLQHIALMLLRMRKAGHLALRDFWARPRGPIWGRRQFSVRTEVVAPFEGSRWRLRTVLLKQGPHRAGSSMCTLMMEQACAHR